MIKDNFFDRKNYLDILEKRIRGLKEGYRQNIAIIGDELIGKTSIIFRLLNKFYDNRIILLYVEVRLESLNSFIQRFIGILLYNFLINSGIALKEELVFLIKKSQKYIPRTVEKIRLILSSLEKRKKENIFTELFMLCEIIYQETGKFCVIILDEFHHLQNLGIKNLYEDWSKLLILQRNTMYIIISSMKFKAQNILSKNLSLLFGNFEIITVEPFDIKTTEEYLQQSVGKLLNLGLRNFLVHFTGGHPFYLELISDAITKADQPNLVDILEDLLFASSGILNQKFSNYLKTAFKDNFYSQDYISILYAISCGHNRFKDLMHILHKNKKGLIPRINYLLELEAISRWGDFLKINDRIFGYWLKFVYQEKLHSLTFDAKIQKALFRDRINAMIDEFLLSAKKPIIERTIELLRLFEDGLIQVEDKKLRLSQFREIKSLEFKNEGLKEGLICRSSDSLWVMAFKHDVLCEEDITNFVRECRKYRHKLQKKIIITFQNDIDINTRLRALEKKIWTWNLNNLNQIMDLFSRPRIII